MARGWFCLYLGLAFLSLIRSLPVLENTTTTPDSTFSAKSERSWLWGWAWGAESIVSVVDRSPVLSFPSRPGTSPHLFPFFSSSTTPKPPLVLKYVIPYWAMSFHFPHLRPPARQIIPVSPLCPTLAAQTSASTAQIDPARPGLLLSKEVNVNLSRR